MGEEFFRRAVDAQGCNTSGGEEVVFVVQPLVTLRAERYGGGIVFIEP